MIFPESFKKITFIIEIMAFLLIEKLKMTKNFTQSITLREN